MAIQIFRQVKVDNLKERLSSRHAEKLIPPRELISIQTLLDSSSIKEKCQILNNLNSYEPEQIKRLFQLLSRQRNGVQSLISIREAIIKERLKGKTTGLLTGKSKYNS